MPSSCETLAEILRKAVANLAGESGDYPKDLVIFPDNKHIAVANHASNTVTTFTVDYDKNIIVMNDKPHHIETPNSIHIWPVPDEVAPEGAQPEEQEEFE